MFESLRSIITSLAIASVIGTLAQGYASAATQGSAVQGGITTAGVVVDDVDYVTSGQALQAVTFRVADTSTPVSIRLSSNSQWIPCTNSSGAVRCETKDYPVSALTKLEIAAHG